MRQKKFLFLTIQQLILLMYFSLTTIIFFLSLSEGNMGVTLRIFGGSDDGYFYWEQAKNIASDQDAILTTIYPLIIGYIIKITGYESVYLIRIFNYIGFIILVTLGLKLLKILFDIDRDEYKLKQANHYLPKVLFLITCAVYLSLIMNVTLSIYRDIWIYSSYLASVILSVKLLFQKKNSSSPIVLMGLAFSLWLLGSFRGYALLSFVLTILIYFAYKKFSKIKKNKSFIIMLLILFAVYYTLLKDFIVPIVNLSLRDALNYRNFAFEFNSGNSQMWIDLDQGNFLVFLFNFIHSYFGNLLGPLPWHIGSASTLLVFLIESLPFLFILLFLWKNRKLLSPVQLYILLHAFVWISLIAITNDNIGTATRLRPVAWLLIIIVFVFTYFKYYCKKKVSN